MQNFEHISRWAKISVWCKFGVSSSKNVKDVHFWQLGIFRWSSPLCKFYSWTHIHESGSLKFFAPVLSDPLAVWQRIADFGPSDWGTKPGESKFSKSTQYAQTTSALSNFCFPTVKALSPIHLFYKRVIF